MSIQPVTLTHQVIYISYPPEETNVKLTINQCTQIIPKKALLQFDFFDNRLKDPEIDINIPNLTNEGIACLFSILNGKICENDKYKYFFSCYPYNTISQFLTLFTENSFKGNSLTDIECILNLAEMLDILPKALVSLLQIGNQKNNGEIVRSCFYFILTSKIKDFPTDQLEEMMPKGMMPKGFCEGIKHLRWAIAQEKLTCRYDQKNVIYLVSQSSKFLSSIITLCPLVALDLTLSGVTENDIEQLKQESYDFLSSLHLENCQVEKIDALNNLRFLEIKNSPQLKMLNINVEELHCENCLNLSAIEGIIKKCNLFWCPALLQLTSDTITEASFDDCPTLEKICMPNLKSLTLFSCLKLRSNSIDAPILERFVGSGPFCEGTFSHPNVGIISIIGSDLTKLNAPTAKSISLTDCKELERLITPAEEITLQNNVKLEYVEALQCKKIFITDCGKLYCLTLDIAEEISIEGSRELYELDIPVAKRLKLFSCEVSRLVAPQLAWFSCYQSKIIEEKIPNTCDIVGGVKDSGIRFNINNDT